MADHTLLDVPVISDVDDPGWGWVYRGIERLNIVTSLRHGRPDDCRSAVEDVVELQNQVNEIKHMWVAVSDDSREPESVIGKAWAFLPIDSNTEKSDSSVSVHPSSEETSVGDDLFTRAEDFALAHGRTTCISYCEYGATDEVEPFLTAPDGGDVPAEAYSVKLALRHGYSVAEANWASVLHLPVPEDTWTDLWRQGDSDHDGYGLRVWEGPVPDELLADYAVMLSRFPSLAPSGDVGWEDEVWDAERVRRDDDDQIIAGNVHLRVAAEDLRTGELVGFTDLFCRPTPSTTAIQDVTLVMPGHRGHHLGLWLKMTNLAELHKRHPRIQTIYTWNAQENTHMLGINIAMGFVPMGGEAVMMKKLA